MANKFVVITSIFSPTEAVKKFAQISDWQLIVVGDQKTPKDWQHEGVIYLGPEDQEKLGYASLQRLPWNHYCRKLAGYLYAMSQGAKLIADSDDDNIPLDNWPLLPSQETYQTLSGTKFVNIYKRYTNEPVWPRGYPLPRLLEKDQPIASEQAANVGIWQFLANEDPDVDAIYRLTNNTLIDFNDGPHTVLAEGTVCPFNSQNTIFHKALFPLLYLPAFVTFRFTDILRGLVAQPIMWRQGYNLGFGPATVVQKRNPHDYLRDFESEVPVYLHSEKVIDIVSEALGPGDVYAQLLAAYKNLLAATIVTDQEIGLLEAWLSDVRSIVGA
jgi:hypothetical protein